MKDDLKLGMLKGHIKIFGRKVGENNWNLLVDKDNLILNIGRTLLRDKLTGEDTTNYLQAFGVGIGTTPPAVTDTGLEIPVIYDGGSNIYKTYEEFTEDDFQTITFVGYLSSTQITTSTDLTEIILCTGTGATVGTAYCRATFDKITKDNTLELRIEYTQKI